MNKHPFYYLSSCDTCHRILGQLPVEKLELINIRESPPDLHQLKLLKDKAGSYRALFNTRAQLLKSMSLDEKPVTEEDFLTLLMQHYTFLKRPVALVNDNIFIGNNPDTIEALVNALTHAKCHLRDK